MKANSSPWILRTLLADGVGIDAVSPAEAVLATRCGYRPQDIFYSANNCSDAELDWARSSGFVINIGEFSRLEAYANRHPGAEICVRLNLNIGAGHHEHVVTGGAKSKFGIGITDLDRALEVALRNDLRIVGIHQHIGSGSTEAESLAEGIAAIAEVAANIDGLRFVNMGGGFGVSYSPGQPSIDLQRVAEIAEPSLRRLVEKDVAIWFEPGRFLVAEAGLLLTRVNSIKQSSERTFVGTDSGMNHLMRPSLYGAYHGIYNVSNPEAASQVYDVVGNICETGDFFARERSIPEVREGDLLAILDAGAYSMSMASLYNLRPLPSEVAILESGRAKLLTERLSPEQLVDSVLAAQV